MNLASGEHFGDLCDLGDTQLRRRQGYYVDRIADATIAYLDRQIEAGAEAVKIFDSWAGTLNWRDFERYCVAPTRRIVAALKEKHPETPVIGFPRGAGGGYERFAQETKVDAVAVDSTVSPDWARERLQPICTVQGNLDPLLMVTGGDELDRQARQIVAALRGGGHVFNLGHGITPDADPANVERLIETVRSA